MASAPTPGVLYAEEARARIFLCKLQLHSHERRISDTRYILDECGKNSFLLQERFLKPHVDRIGASERRMKILSKEVTYLEMLVEKGLPEAGRLIRVPEAGSLLPKYTYPSSKLEDWRSES